MSAAWLSVACVGLALWAQDGRAPRAPDAAAPRAQDAAPPRAQDAAPTRASGSVAARMAALDPSRPIAYLELAEELVDAAPSDSRGDADRAHAIELAGQAGALDVAGLGRSAALFILDASRDPVQRARMSALAEVLGSGGISAGSAIPSAASRADPSAVLALARAFAAYARGQAAPARAAIGQRGAAELLDEHPELLPGGAARFRADCDRMRDGVAPVFTAAQADALHALIGAALSPGSRTWSESIALYGRAPLPDFDLSKPGELFGVTVPRKP